MRKKPSAKAAVMALLVAGFAARLNRDALWAGAPRLAAVRKRPANQRKPQYRSSA
jgi:hypothetical protein